VIYILIIKFSRASSRVKWLRVDKNEVSRTISVLVLRGTSVDAAGSPGEFYYT
jgi:hypothetical protein